MDRHFCCKYVLIEIKGANDTDHKFIKLLFLKFLNQNAWKAEIFLEFILTKISAYNTFWFNFKILTLEGSQISWENIYQYIFIKITYYWGRVIIYKSMVGFLGSFYFYQYILITSVLSSKDSLACCTTGSILMCWAVVSRIRSPGMCRRIYHCTRTRFMGTSCT